MAAIPLHREEIVYPTSDGQPMAETTLHRKIMTDLIQGLDRRYRDVPDVWVGGNLFFYFEKGRPEAVVAPDVLLVQGVRKWDRPIYRLWEEGRVPSLVVEVTSGSTRDEDLSKKKGIYQRLGVEEYFLFDPYGDYLDPRLQGQQLEEGRYVPMTPQARRHARQLHDRPDPPTGGRTPAAGRSSNWPNPVGRGVGRAGAPGSRCPAGGGGAGAARGRRPAGSGRRAGPPPGRVGPQSERLTRAVLDAVGKCGRHPSRWTNWRCLSPAALFRYTYALL